MTETNFAPALKHYAKKMEKVQKWIDRAVTLSNELELLAQEFPFIGDTQEFTDAVKAIDISFVHYAYDSADKIKELKECLTTLHDPQA